MNTERVGETTTILVDGFDYNNGLYYGHDNKNAPGVDFKFYIDSDCLNVGDFYQVTINDYVNRDFITTLINKGEHKWIYQTKLLL